MYKTIEDEQAEDRQKRIDSRHQAGLVFGSVEDLKWLYFDLVLKGAFVDGDKERELENLVYEPFWVSDESYELSTLNEQAARYVDMPLYHCTALRDFLIVRLIGYVANLVADDPPPLMTNRLWPAFVVPIVGIVTGAFLWALINWWSAVVVIVLAFIEGSRWGRRYDNNSRNKYSRRHYQVRDTRNSIFGIRERVRQGGFDAPTIIHQLEMHDAKLPPPEPTIVYKRRTLFVYKRRTPFVVTVNGEPLAIAPLVRIPIPDVLYALLRLPRRNVESEIVTNLVALNEDKKRDLEIQWRRFVDQLLNYSEA